MTLRQERARKTNDIRSVECISHLFGSSSICRYRRVGRISARTLSTEKIRRQQRIMEPSR